MYMKKCMHKLYEDSLAIDNRDYVYIVSVIYGLALYRHVSGSKM